MNKRTKRVKTILGVVGMASFLYALGTVGALDLDIISIKTGFIRSTLGIIVTGLCVVMNNQIDEWLQEARLARVKVSTK